MYRKYSSITLIVLLVVLTVGTASAQYDFGCGELTADPESGCLFFHPTFGGVFALDDPGEFHAGDIVHVTGELPTISNPCDIWCSTYLYRCIHNAVVTECEMSTGCCQGRVGDANGLGGDEPTIGDVSVMIDAKYITGRCEGIINCIAEADVNQSGGCNPTCDDITISDISILIDFHFITGPSLYLPPCLSCPIE